MLRTSFIRRAIALSAQAVQETPTNADRLRVAYVTSGPDATELAKTNDIAGGLLSRISPAIVTPELPSTLARICLSVIRQARVQKSKRKHTKKEPFASESPVAAEPRPANWRILMHFVGHLTCQQAATPGSRSQRQHIRAARSRSRICDQQRHRSYPRHPEEAASAAVSRAMAVGPDRFILRGSLRSRLRRQRLRRCAGMTARSPSFSPAPFPLRPKTLYGAARFAVGEVEIMIDIKGLA